MSNTNRNIKHANVNARRLRHHNYLVQEAKAIDEINEEGCDIKSNRLKSFKSRIPTNWEDIQINNEAT